MLFAGQQPVVRDTANYLRAIIVWKSVDSTMMDGSI